MDAEQRDERTRRLRDKRLADRPRMAAYLLHVVNDASDYQNDFTVLLTRSEIYTILETLRLPESEHKSING